MLTKNQIKYIQSLHQKKFRQLYGAFLVEGAKSVQEVCASDFEVEQVLMTESFYKENGQRLHAQPSALEIVSEADLQRIGTLETNKAALAVVKTKPNRAIEVCPDELILVLDEVRDPGNLGTILRIADWYGVQKLVFSETTAEVYNPKVISASKGSFTRVTWWYTDLPDWLKTVSQQTPTPIFGAMLEGQNVHRLRFPKGGLLVMGNESNGIRPDVQPYLTNRITIPSFGGGAESLNVGIATAVLLDNWRKNS